MTIIGARAGRGHLARLVVVVVLAGLAFMAGVQCRDGMSTAMPMSGGTTMSMDEHPSDQGTGTDEAIMMCLVVVFAVAAAAVVLTLRAVRASAVAQVPTSVVRSDSVRPRAPSLTRLCSLRI